MNSVVEPAQFVGRYDEIATLQRNAGGCVVVIGGSRIGKTSLLNFYLRSSQGLPRGIKGVWLSHLLLRLRSERTFERLLLRSAAEALDQPYVSNERLPVALHQILTLSANGVRGLVFVIDEVDTLLGKTWSDSAFATIQFLVDADHPTRGLIGFVLAGLRGLNDYRETEGSRLHGKSVPLYLGPLSSEASHELIRRERLALNMKLNPSAEERLLRQSGGHPFLLKAMLNLHQTLGFKATQELVYDRYGAVIRDWWQGSGGLSEVERLVYVALLAQVRRGKAVLPQDLVIPALTLADCRNALRTLNWMGLIFRSKRGYMRGAGLVEQYIFETRPRERDEWDDSSAGWALAASHVHYSHSAVNSAVTSNEALRILRKEVTDRTSASFGGYFDSQTLPVHQADALFRYLRDRPIVYVAPPPRWVRNGQKIRSVDYVLNEGRGTCLDLTLAYVALMEAIGLQSGVLLAKGHALVGLWMRPDVTSHVVVKDRSIVSDWVKSGVLLPIDVVASSSPSATFEDAVSAGRHYVSASAFEGLINIPAARRRGIEPHSQLADNERTSGRP